MPATVTFTCVEGPLKGKTFSFRDRANFLIGRSDDCVIAIPKSEETMEISRHHCLIDLSPPLARIRDFGSLNGTYVNGERIGGRDPSQKAGDAMPAFPQRDLTHGDTIRLANVVISVAIEAPGICDECGAEISEKDMEKARVEAKRHVCDGCRAKKEAELKRRQEEEKRKREQAVADAGKRAREQALAEAEARRKEQERQAEAARRKAEEARRAAPPAGKPDPMAIIQAILQRAMQGAPEVQNIKGYKILKTLGRGGMGAVYLARKEDTGNEVALKVMLPQVAGNREAVARFRREMDNATVLRHPNIVQSYESGFASNIFYLTMEVCNAGSMQDLLQKKGGKLTIDQGVSLMLQALEGLKYLHKAPIPNVKLANGRYGKGTGLVHRDLKPANLFLNESNGKLTVKIADLGLAKAFDQAGLSGLTMTGQVAGSPPFMPRQQVVDYLHAKPEVDVWAMAATFYNILTGAFPRNFIPGKDVWLTILQTDPVPIRQRNALIPERLARVIDAALVDRPKIAYTSIDAFHKDVLKAL